MFDVFSAFGLSSSAGLNAYLPLLLVGLFSRFTDFYDLSDPWDQLTNVWVLLALGGLLVIEFLVDKVPGVDTVNDVISTLIRPAAGALLFASTTESVGNMHPALAMILGLTTAGAVHATKSTARPLVTTSTAGVGNTFVSIGEDLLSLVLALAATFLPVIAALLVLALIIPIFQLWRWRRRQAEALTVRA